MSINTFPFEANHFKKLFRKEFHPDAAFLGDFEPHLSFLEQDVFRSRESLLFLSNSGNDSTVLMDEFDQSNQVLITHEKVIYDFKPYERIKQLLSSLSSSHEISIKINDGCLNSENIYPSTASQIQPHVINVSLSREHILGELLDNLLQHNFGFISTTVLKDECLEYDYDIYTDWLFKHLLSVVAFEKK